LLDDTGRSDDDINSDGSTLEIRIDKYGLATGVAQNIAYGETDAQKLLIKMLVDDGFSGRERRYNILNPAYAYFGVYTTSDTTNSTNGHQHCMKFAETYVDNQYD
jgi:uncharacterized protein YkwD